MTYKERRYLPEGVPVLFLILRTAGFPPGGSADRLLSGRFAAGGTGGQEIFAF